MTTQSMTWLNNMTLVGFTDKMGMAWTYRAALQGTESNHYPGAIPLDDVIRRLLFWTPQEGDVSTNILTPEGVVTMRDESRKTVVRLPGTFTPDDPGNVFYVPKVSWRRHDYQEWCIENIGVVLDRDLDSLQISSAGLLDDGAVFWCQMQMPENIETAEGVVIRPFISMATSINGSMSTTGITGTQCIVCDNTLKAAQREAGAGKAKVKHSSQSLTRLDEFREGLGLRLEVESADFQAELTRMCNTPVSSNVWTRFLDLHTELFDPKTGEKKTGRSLTTATKEWDGLMHMWNHDDRVSPWAGTEFGVVQATNTWLHHEQTVRNVSRVQRNMERAVKGGVEAETATVLATLHQAKALAAAA